MRRRGSAAGSSWRRAALRWARSPRSRRCRLLSPAAPRRSAAPAPHARPHRASASRSWPWAAAAGSSCIPRTRRSASSRRPSASASTTSTPRSTTATARARRRVGRVMATRRKDVFLATKVPTRARTRDAALREVEASLKRLQTDHVDLLHMHSLGDEEDLAKIEAAGRRAQGALRVARPEGRALHRHDQPHRRRGDGEGHRAERPRLRADGHEPGARAALRGAGAARRRTRRTSASS